MEYTLSYDRREVKYTLQCGQTVNEFSSPYITAMWNFIGNTLEPGDTLHWVAAEEGDPS